MLKASLPRVAEFATLSCSQMATWPKQLPVLTDEQKRVREDFVKYWHEVLPRRYGAIERFNHMYPLRQLEAERPNITRALEIGAGLGEHIEYEALASVEYYALELREEMASRIRARFPGVQTIVGDIQKRVGFDAGYFNRIIAIHVLEHLPNLPAAIQEIHRLLHPSGRFDVVIPCEGGLAYTLARRISAQRIFEKRYKMPYGWFVRSEHINLPAEILGELNKSFTIDEVEYFPFHVASVNMNLVIGLRLRPRVLPGS